MKVAIDPSSGVDDKAGLLYIWIALKQYSDRATIILHMQNHDDGNSSCLHKLNILWTV